MLLEYLCVEGALSCVGQVPCRCSLCRLWKATHIISFVSGPAGHSAPGFAGAAAQLQGRERTYAETVHALNDAQNSGQPFDAIAGFSAACTSQPTGTASWSYLPC